MRKILVVDDEYSIRKTISLLLEAEGYSVLQAESLEGARLILEKEAIDLVITDLRLASSNGLDLLVYLNEIASDTECIVLTAYGTIENAVECMRLGAYDYLTKPVNPAEMIVRIKKVLEKKSMSEELGRLRKELATRAQLSDLVAESPQMQQLVELIRRIRSSDIPVLITGETGTGKEVVARSIYAVSTRAKRPYVAINCCTLPEDLLDSELFGHVKGAFTGATSSTQGLFQQADGGTLFLDEIGDISPRLQSKLLRVLQNGEIRPVGGGPPFQIDVRIIAATNRDLEAMIESKEFRADLYFRLNGLPIAIPPLRERPQDISPMIDFTLKRLKVQLDNQELSITPAARKKLTAYHWPGNVRQLENVIERGFALSVGPILDVEDIVFGYAQSVPGTESEGCDSLDLDKVVTHHVKEVLTTFGGNQVAAAKALGISRSTLRRKLEEAG